MKSNDLKRKRKRKREHLSQNKCGLKTGDRRQ